MQDDQENPSITILLDEAAPPRLREALVRTGRVVVHPGPSSAIVTEDGVRAVETAVLGAHEVEDLLSRGRPASPRLVFIRAAVDPATAARLEDSDVAYVDQAGRSWLPGDPRSGQAQASGPSTRRALRAESMRAAQLLADHPGDHWTERRLAERAETTPVTAHRLLRRLEEADIIVRSGSTRGTSRHVRSAADLRAWLLATGPPSATRLLCFVPDPRTIGASADGHALVLTGAAAAERMGFPVITAEPRPTYRVQCSPEELEDVPSALGGLRTDLGANVTLLADPGRLAQIDARPLSDGTIVAPPSRVMLDILLEQRGDAAAKLFLDLWAESSL